jgi:hypothetical protein
MESSDGTPEIARNLGARVIAVAADPDFNRSRKVGLEASTNDWILALDADEMVPVELATTLSERARHRSDDVLLIPRLNFKLGCQQNAGLWPDYQRRFYRKGTVEFVSAVHDYLIVPSNRMAFLPPRVDLALHHFNYIPVSKDIEKLNLYTTSDVLSRSRLMPLAPVWTSLKTFVSLYFKRLGMRDGIPGLWWSAFRSFTDLVQHRKQLELRMSGTVACTEKEIAELNTETTMAAKLRVENGRRQCAVSLPRLVGKLIVGFPSGGSLDSRAWRAARNAFCDLVLEVKVWELASGRTMAERAQDTARAEISAEWARYGV